MTHRKEKGTAVPGTRTAGIFGGKRKLRVRGKRSLRKEPQDRKLSGADTGNATGEDHRTDFGGRKVFLCG